MDARNNLIDAACHGDVERVRTMLQTDPTIVHTRDPHLRSTALHFSAHRGYVEIVQLLLRAGADVNAREGTSDTIPLHWAAEGGHLEVVKLLVDHGSAVNTIDSWRQLGPLGWAVASHHHDVADFLLTQQAQLDIFSAIAWGKPDAVRALIAADPTVLRQQMGVAEQRQQPLHLAVLHHLPEMVELLLEAGADLHMTTAWGLTPLGLAALLPHERIVELLRAHHADSDLSAAVTTNHLDQAKALLEADSSLVHADGPYARLLHFTVQQGRADATALLLRYGADPNIPAEYLHHEIVCTLSPLHVAAWHGHTEAARVLVEHGADLLAQDQQYDSTPYIWAKWHHQEEVAALLKQRGRTV